MIWVLKEEQQDQVWKKSRLYVPRVLFTDLYGASHMELRFILEMAASCGLQECQVISSHIISANMVR
jgi:hypothetical protein